MRPGNKRIARRAMSAVLLLPLAWAALAPSAIAQEPALASDRIAPARLEEYSQLAVRWMREYLRLNTTNPPGNETRAAAFLKKILDEEGIENQVFDFAPGRANVWARLAHQGGAPRRPLVLLNHMDVVTSDAAHWQVAPFSGQVINGAMYGRGAQDMKNEGIAQLVALVMLKREQLKLARDVIFLATADEEVGGSGTDWMIAHHRDRLGDAEYLLTEGGENLFEEGRVKYVGVDTAEKSPFWLHVVAHGQPGHASRPIEESAPNRLVRALGRIINYNPPLKVLPVVQEYLDETAAYQLPEQARRFRNLQASLRDRSFRRQVAADPSLNYLLRNTVSVTMLGGAEQTNVIPAEAWANLDVRLLPGEAPHDFLELLRRTVGDPSVEIQPVNKEFRVANASSTRTELFGGIREVCRRYFPGAPVTPRLTSGYTENQRYRQLGIVSYGFSPYTVMPEEGESEHGNNERIRLEELRRGPRVLFDVVARVAEAR
jgi:acetylornithine deacetylase/succinyl-diaminopimelate desuccinylase-like protein